MKKTTLSTDSISDSDLFKEWIGTVKPIPHHGKAVVSSKKPKPIPLQTIKDEKEALHASLSDISWEDGLEIGEELSYARNGVSRDTLRQLKRGKWVIQAELDLHGLNRLEAKEAFVTFLNRCSKRGWRCIRIIHGKGLRSARKQPVLKTLVRNWLMQRDEVLAFSQAKITDGGAGAVIVLLRGN